jgi:protein-disulfide isomerase
VIIEYSDFQCPFCARFAKDVLPILSSKYVEKGSLAFVFRHLPLNLAHPRAAEAAIAAECAGRQGQFWTIHDQLFRTQADAARWNMQSIASDAGVDVSTWASCINGSGKDRVASDARHAQELGVSSTPLFLIGLRQAADTIKVTDVIVGAQPVEAFEQIVERLLRR